MRFLVHGAVDSAAQAALLRHKQACHAWAELTANGAVPVETDGPGLLLPLLEKKQWNLITTDAAFVHAMYEEKTAFNGVVILILENSDEPQDQGDAIDRLFARYKRLTARRLYTITPSRVKIRQLPGAL